MRTFIIMFTMLILSGSSTSAQTWAEWFKQKKTQQKYLIQQIAGLQVYIEFAKKGYELTTKGLNTVRAIKSGDFNLHNDFFKGLGQVNLNVKNTYQSLLVVFLFQQIIKIGNNLNSNAKNTHLLLPDEMGYLQSVIENLKDDCSALLDGTLDIITSGNLKMSDDERLERLDALLDQMKKNYDFLKTFDAETIVLIKNREKERLDIESIQELNRKQ